MYSVFQPYIDLANANMAAFSRLTDSPELPKMMKTDTDTYLQQVRGFFAHTMKSDALAEWSKATLKNYSDFVTAVSQSFYGMVSTGQTFITDQTKEISRSVQLGADNIVDAQEVVADSVDAELTEAAPARTARQKRTHD